MLYIAIVCRHAEGISIIGLVDLPVNNFYQQGELQRYNSGSILQLSLKKVCRARFFAAPRETGVCPYGQEDREGHEDRGDREDREGREGREGRGVGDGGGGHAKRARCTGR